MQALPQARKEAVLAKMLSPYPPTIRELSVTVKVVEIFLCFKQPCDSRTIRVRGYDPG